MHGVGRLFLPAGPTQPWPVRLARRAGTSRFTHTLGEGCAALAGRGGAAPSALRGQRHPPRGHHTRGGWRTALTHLSGVSAPVEHGDCLGLHTRVQERNVARSGLHFRLATRVEVPPSIARSTEGPSFSCGSLNHA